MTTDVVLVAGARPNFVKVKPVLDHLEAQGLTTALVHTGQHYDAQMSDVFFDDLGIRPPDVSLGVGSGSHAQQTAAVMIAFEDVLDSLEPRVVVVVGDVNSTVACALVAAKAGCLVAHVEAGLRSRDWSMPEEVNRVVTDRLSDLLLAPSDDAADNLRAEGFRPDQIALAGNVMIDSLLANLGRARDRRVPLRLGLEPGQYGIITLHRPSNVDCDGSLPTLLEAIAEGAGDLPLIFPVHPRSREKLDPQRIPMTVRLIEPLGYLDFLGLQADSMVVITDSGGIQEETTALGVPCVTARESTERPITVTNGTNVVGGTRAETLIPAIRSTLAAPPSPRSPSLWDGRAGDRASRAIVAMLNEPRWPRPSEVIR